MSLGDIMKQVKGLDVNSMMKSAQENENRIKRIEQLVEYLARRERDREKKEQESKPIA